MDRSSGCVIARQNYVILVLSGERAQVSRVARRVVKQSMLVGQRDKINEINMKLSNETHTLQSFESDGMPAMVFLFNTLYGYHMRHNKYFHYFNNIRRVCSIFEM